MAVSKGNICCFSAFEEVPEMNEVICVRMKEKLFNCSLCQSLVSLNTSFSQHALEFIHEKTPVSRGEYNFTQSKRLSTNIIKDAYVTNLELKYSDSKDYV